MRGHLHPLMEPRPVPGRAGQRRGARPLCIRWLCPVLLWGRPVRPFSVLFFPRERTLGHSMETVQAHLWVLGITHP